MSTSHQGGESSPSQTIEKQKLRVVVAGEVNSGKSAVLNALLRDKVMPDFFGQEAKPCIMVTYGDEKKIEAHYYDGSSKAFAGWDEVGDLANVSHCTFSAPLDNLKEIEFVEVPFVHDGKIEAEILNLVGTADVLVWTTIASQAWRLSEKTIVDQFAVLEIPRKVLAVSRGDKLRNDNDRSRIGERLAMETGGLFAEILFMHASKKAVLNSQSEIESWESTKGKTLFEKLGTLGAESRDIIAQRGDVVSPTAEVASIVSADDAAAFDDDALDERGFDGAAELDADEAEEAPRPAPQATPEPEPEATEANPQGASDYADMKAVVSTLNGVVAAVVMSKNGDAVPLAGTDSTVSKAFEVVHGWQGLVKDEAFFSEALDMQVRMGEHTLLMRTLEEASEVVLILTNNKQVAPGIANAAFSKMTL